MVSTSAAEAIHEILQAQARRAQLYAAFQTAFREMCDSNQEAMYLKLLPQLTDEFRIVSEGVIACEKRLATQGQTELAKLVRSIQENERTKLQATITLQALQKAQAFETLPWQNGNEAAWSEAKPSPSGGISHSCCHHGHSSASVVPDQSQVTEPEWQAACAEATSALEQAVRSINDSMEEMRYELLEEGSQ